MKNLFNKIGLVLFMSFASMPAWAIKASDIAENTQDEASAIGAAAVTVAFLFGIVFVIIGLIKLKAHKDNPQQTPLSVPIVLIIVGGLLSAVMAIVTIAGDSTGLSEAGDDVTYQKPDFN